MQTEMQQKWKNNSVNKARRSRKTKRLLNFCYRATQGGETPIFYSEDSFRRFCDANKGSRVGGVINDDCLGCKIKGIPSNIAIMGAE